MAAVTPSRHDGEEFPNETGTDNAREREPLQISCWVWKMDSVYWGVNGAGNGIRTRDFNLGKVALYH